MTHIITKDLAEYADLLAGNQTFFIHKIEKYAIDPADRLIFQELKDGEHTGNEFVAKASHVFTEGLVKNKQAVGIVINPEQGD